MNKNQHVFAKLLSIVWADAKDDTVVPFAAKKSSAGSPL